MNLLLQSEKGNKLVLLTAALLHDIKRDEKQHEVASAQSAEQLLQTISEFPSILIPEVCRIITHHEREQLKPDEQLLYDADKMDAFNELAVVRSFMMYAREGLTLEGACRKYLILIDTFYKSLHSKVAKNLINKKYIQTRLFAKKLISYY